MQGGLRLSEKWGLNGTNLVCPICGEPQGFSYLGQIDEEDSQAPKYTFTDPCDKCQSILNADGVFFIEIVSETNDIRTGRVGELCLHRCASCGQVVYDVRYHQAVVTKRLLDGRYPLSQF